MFHASGWAHGITKVALDNTGPGENKDDAAIVGAIVSRGNAVTFLTTLLVDLLESLSEHVVPLSSALDEAQLVDWFILDSFVTGEVLWGGSGSMSDTNVDWVGADGAIIFGCLWVRVVVK